VTGKVRISPSVTSFYHWHIVHMKSIEIPNLIHENGTDEFFHAMGWKSPACTAEGKGHHALFFWVSNKWKRSQVTPLVACCCV
jgi:hypothetical protein